MKKIGLITVFVLVMTAGLWCTSVWGIEGKSNQPPEGLVWNAETNEYYDATEWKWDSQKKRYVSIKQKTELQAEEKMIADDPRNVWVEQNLHSQKPLYKALVMFYIESQNQTSLNAVYEPEADLALRRLTGLGMPKVAEMLREIKEGNPFAGYLMYTVQNITGVKELSLVDVTEKGRKQWLESFRQKLLEAPTAAKDKQSSAESISSFGVLIVPHLLDEVVAGNNRAAGLLVFVSDGSGIGRDLGYWQQWRAKNMDHMKQIAAALE